MPTADLTEWHTGTGLILREPQFACRTLGACLLPRQPPLYAREKGVKTTRSGGAGAAPPLRGKCRRAVLTQWRATGVRLNGARGAVSTEGHHPPPPPIRPPSGAVGAGGWGCSITAGGGAVRDICCQVPGNQSRWTTNLRRFRVGHGHPHPRHRNPGAQRHSGSASDGNKSVSPREGQPVDGNDPLAAASPRPARRGLNGRY